ncbi:hypothetical protein [Sandaracinus amylolyticus]|uniref:hypothetical protein n=1 Tax=Sandaracinus amylolyticus TaxID=927083 RepID=UPI001F28B5B9|nr:hypothetical protein [Sandaracinus amylolyticus]UJR81412.1 Hypothetical protein I5071_34700 [Sandaracinus amylolyticus]
MTRERVVRGLGVLVVALIAMGALWSPAFLTGASGWGDWQWFHHMWEAGRVAYVRWGELPLWNPHHCGGVPLWGNPQAQVYSPTYLIFALPFGTNLGHKLFVLFHAVVGFASMYTFARREVSLTRIASLLAAIAWCASGFFAWHGAGGHATFLAFYYAPALLLAWRAAERDLRWCGVVAAWMVLIVLEGGHYPFPYFVLLLAFDALVRAFALPRLVPRLAAVAALSGALTGLLGAARFLPILFALRANPHPVPDPDWLSPSEILEMLTARTHDYRFAGHGWVWPEYGAYVGWAIVVLSALGLAAAFASITASRTSARSRATMLWLVLGLVLFFLFTQGSATPHHPWPLLQELPFYRSIHVPSRFRVLLIFFMALLAGVALDRIAQAIASLPVRADVRALSWAIPWTLVLAITIDLYVINVGIIDRWNEEPVGVRAPVDHHLVRGRSYLDEYANYPSENVGTIECYDPVPWPRSTRLWLGEGPQARIVPEEAGRVIAWGRTSLTVWADIELDEPALVVFNQNHADDWTSAQGQVISDDVRLAVDVQQPRGRMRVEARYFPRDLPYTVGLSLTGAIACVVLALAPWRRRRARQAGAPTV